MMKRISTILLLVSAEASFALQGGPTQPDYTQFEPSGMQDMVSMQSGDFSYQIPLSDLPSPYGNYPLSLSYHAGISPQQEASWVGLGWTLNPGSINRDVRGVPDDQFHGGTLGFIYRYSSMQTWAVDLGYSNGVFSVGQTFSSDGSVGFSASVGPKIAGVVSVGFSVGTDAIGLNASVGNQTASLNAGMMVSTTNGKANASIGAKLSAGGASLGAQVSTGGGASANVGFGNSKAGVGLSVSANGVSTSAHVGQVAMSKSKNGTSVSVGGGTLSVSNSSSKGKNKTSTAGFAIVVPTQIGVFSFGFSQNTYEYWMRSATSEYLYGYMYQAGPAIDVKEENMITGMPDTYTGAYKTNGNIKWDVTAKGRTLEHLGGNLMYPAYDMYSVSSEGVSGSFRPFAREAHQLHMKVSSMTPDGKERNDKNVETYSMILKDDGNGWAEQNEFTLSQQKETLSNKEYLDYQTCLAQSGRCSLYGLYQTNYRNNGNRLVYNSDENEFEEHGGMRFLFVGENGGYFESEQLDGSKSRPAREVFKELLIRKDQTNYEHALYGSKKIEPLFEKNDPSGRLQGFVITTADGSKYFFTQPVKSYLKTDYSINQRKGAPVFVDKSTSKNEDFVKNLFSGLLAIGKWSLEHVNPVVWLEDTYDFFFKSGHLNETCKNDNDGKNDDYFYSYTVNMNPHATQWLLTEIQGADFVKLGENIEDNIGYNVKFHYSKNPSLYHWRTPYARPGLNIAELPNFKQAREGLTPEGCDSKMYQASFGVKENVYLESIETATHKVEFTLNKQERVDGKGWQTTAENRMPILVATSLKYNWTYDANNVSSKIQLDNNGRPKYVQNATVSILPETIYFNSELPQTVVDKLKKNGTITVWGLGSVKVGDEHYFKVTNAENEAVEIKISDDAKVSKCVSKEDLKFGLYKIDFTSNPENSFSAFFSITDPDSDRLSNYLKNNVDKASVVMGENGNVQQLLMLDWGGIIFATDKTNDPYENQMRYLEKIQYKNKSDMDHPYKEYAFNYDYSLQPKTLNSYCLKNDEKNNGYPENTKQIADAEENVKTGICEEGYKKGLYGKLTLRSIKETGCLNGKCSSLPPFKFSYNSPSASPTRVSLAGEWKTYFPTGYSVETADGKFEFKESEDFEKISDLDATILASANTTDEYGFWSNTANLENHKVDPYLATYGASAWSLNQVVDPAGGNLEVEYERDTYKDGEYYANEHLNVAIKGFNECSKYNNDFAIPQSANGYLCFQIGQLYWREQCLGPRPAFWDTKQPLGDETDGYSYLDTIGITKNKLIPSEKDRLTVFYNVATGIKTKVDCGLFGLGSCDRKRTVALMGDGIVVGMYSNKDGKERVLVTDKTYEMVEAGLQRAADKINKDQSWTIDPKEYGSYGNMWVRQSRPIMPGGDLRVSRLTRHDMNLKSQTVYDYGVGELAQLADSSYTTVLGSRFNASKISYALPDVDLKPISRIVGFNDDDAMFLPGARITYPKVSVTNTVNDGESQMNGRTEFKYITPETGVPEEYIDEDTKNKLLPFVKFNIKMFKLKGDYKRGICYPTQYANFGRLFRFSLLDENFNPIDDATKDGKIAKLTKTLYEEELGQLYFYSNNVKKAKYLRVEEIKKSETEVAQFDLSLNEDLGKFNEFMIALRSNYAAVDYKSTMDKVWFRKQKEGFFPILYKFVEYGKKKIERTSLDLKCAFSNDVNTVLPSLFVENDVDSKVFYHDFTAFLGQNYATSFYRGVKNGEILVKKDSSIYSTVAPSALSAGVTTNGNVAEKIGRQVERWTSERQLECENYKDGKENYCFQQNVGLALTDGHSMKTEFTYFRYPAFQIASVTLTGHDNQDKVVYEDANSSSSSAQSSSSNDKFGVTELRNFRFDPIMGSPTATMAVSKFGNKEIRKITQTTPAYVITESPLANKMFLRNMFTQNYLEEVFTDTLNAVNCTTSDLKNDLACELHKTTHADNNKKLRTFSISPYKELSASLYGSSSSMRTPIVAMGTFKNKVAPATIRGNARNYLDYSNIRPQFNDYNGTYITNINKQMKVLETVDVLGRTQSTIFSKDAMFQLSLFFPAKIGEVGVVLPYMNKVFNSEKCSVSGNNEIKNNLIVANGNLTVSCKVECGSGNVAMEYRLWTSSNGWQTKRDVISCNGASITLSSNDKLSYFRVYPENAESKTFIYDINGNMVQSVAEDNTSTYYEYDPFGKLVQSRNDDGVSFKSHHREYMNSEEK